MRASRVAPLVLVLVCARAIPLAAESPEPSLLRLPLVVHVARKLGPDGMEPVVSEAQLHEQVTRANQIFDRYGVVFEIRETRSLPPAHTAMESRDDRDRLAPLAPRGAIHCFFVASLRDVDEPERMRGGVHWHSRTHRGVHYVIVAAYAGRGVLAHELGHFLGNPEHSEVRDNLMSYEQSSAPPFLDAEQLRRMRKRIDRYLRQRELVPLPERDPRSGPPRTARSP